MKLTSVQVERTLSQFDAEAVPDDHPVVPRLNRLFGEHTFFLSGNGLNIIEPAEESTNGRPVRNGGEHCQLERCQSHRLGTSRA